MIDYIDLIIVGLVCLFVGYKIADHIHKSVIADLLHRAGVTPEKLESIMEDLRSEIESPGQLNLEADDDAIMIRIEQHNNTLYAYRKDTEEFLGQGADKDSLIERLALQFPTGARLVLTEDDGAALIKENPTA